MSECQQSTSALENLSSRRAIGCGPPRSGSKLFVPVPLVGRRGCFVFDARSPQGASHRNSIFVSACSQDGGFPMKVRPLQDRVVVRRVKEEEKTKGGIIIPDTAKEKPIEGLVVAVGNGKVQDDGSLRALDVKAGDRILFGKYSGTEVKIDGEDHLILREDDILGVIDGK
jgi:chaperonin GroES